MRVTVYDDSLYTSIYVDSILIRGGSNTWREYMVTVPATPESYRFSVEFESIQSDSIRIAGYGLRARPMREGGAL